MEIRPMTTLQYSHAFPTHSSRRCQIQGVPFRHNLLSATGEILKACGGCWRAIYSSWGILFQKLAQFWTPCKSIYQFWIFSLPLQSSHIQMDDWVQQFVSNLTGGPAKFKENKIHPAFIHQFKRQIQLIILFGHIWKANSKARKKI